MIKYDDFAMPSLENIEHMAKAYSQMEKEYLQKNALKKENKDIVQKVYNGLFGSFEIVTKLCEIYPKNRKFLVINEKLTKLKVQYESDFIDFMLNIPESSYTFSESTIIFDLIKIWSNCIELILNDINNQIISKKYMVALINLIKEIIKY